MARLGTPCKMSYDVKIVWIFQLSGYGLKDVIHLHKLGIKALLGF